ncbi:hypothetical protein ABDD95_07730 [Mucilaginibacter sp. PAMB04274]|uniref:hypothetical protein n=1 Tax=Mucilaginibacter sp. PAMB04274 TaxID=3138568 RepID=UPI0031F665D0
MIAIEPAHFTLFRSGSVFQRTLFLDNFYSHIDIDQVSGPDLAGFLSYVIYGSAESAIKREAFKILADLSIVGKVNNRYTVLSIAHDFVNGNDVHLQVIAMKYLPYFSSSLNVDMIDRITNLSDSPNGDVSSQAYYFLGLHKFTSGVGADDRNSLIVLLNEALRLFQASAESVENRVDAVCFVSFVRFNLSLMYNDHQAMMTAFATFKDELRKYAMYALTETDFTIQYRIFQQVEIIKQIMEHASGADVWLELKPNIEVLMQLQAGRIDHLTSDSVNAGMLSAINGQLLSRLEESAFLFNLANEKRRLAALKDYSSDSDLVAFISYVIDLFPPTSDAPVENLELLAILSGFAGSDEGLTLYQQIQQKDISLEKAISSLLEQQASVYKSFKTGSIYGEEVLISLMSSIDQSLPDYAGDKRQAFMNVLEEVIRYARVTFVNNDKVRFKFLFSESDGGKGQTAIEQDLQDSMLIYLEHSKIADGLEHEKAKFVDGGRVDILYKRDVLTLPIELKRTFLRQDKTSLEVNYIAQAQTYTAGYDQLGIFVLLDLSDKTKAPPPNFKDWFQIHHLSPSTLLDLNYPDFIVSVIIPGNRTLPSSKSMYQ